MMAQVPAALDQLHGEPVEQFGMGGALSLDAEVLRRADETRTEEHLPEVIRDDAGGERIVGRRRATSRGRDDLSRDLLRPGSRMAGHALGKTFAPFCIPDAAHEDVGGRGSLRSFSTITFSLPAADFFTSPSWRFASFNFASAW
jgi:hypothetical protein